MSGRRFPSLASAVLLIVSAAGLMADTARAESINDEVTCASESVKEQIGNLLSERLCLTDKLKLADLTSSISYDERTIALADSITMQESAKPPWKTCEAQLSFELKLRAEAIGPGPGIIYKLRASSAPRTITYKVGRYDNGRTYVRPDPGCWKIDRIRQAD